MVHIGCAHWNEKASELLISIWIFIISFIVLLSIKIISICSFVRSFKLKFINNRGWWLFVIKKALQIVLGREKKCLIKRWKQSEEKTIGICVLLKNKKKISYGQPLAQNHGDHDLDFGVHAVAFVGGPFYDSNWRFGSYLNVIKFFNSAWMRVPFKSLMLLLDDSSSVRSVFGV